MDIVTNFAGLERSLYMDCAVVTIATNDHTLRSSGTMEHSKLGESSSLGSFTCWCLINLLGA